MDSGLQAWCGIALACAVGWLARRVVHELRRRRHRATLLLLRMSALMSAHGRADAAARLAASALACARSGDEPGEALAHERLGDIAQRAGDTRTSLRHWKLAAMMLHVGQWRGDAARVCLKLAAALERAGAPGALRWQRRAALLELAVMDEDGRCATLLRGPQAMDAVGP